MKFYAESGKLQQLIYN